MSTSQNKVFSSPFLACIFFPHPFQSRYDVLNELFGLCIVNFSRPFFMMARIQQTKLPDHVNNESCNLSYNASYIQRCHVTDLKRSILCGIANLHVLLKFCHCGYKLQTLPWSGVTTLYFRASVFWNPASTTRAFGLITLFWSAIVIINTRKGVYTFIMKYTGVKCARNSEIPSIFNLRSGLLC